MMVCNPKIFLGFLVALEVMAQDPAALVGMAQARQDSAAASSMGLAAQQPETSSRTQQAGALADQLAAGKSLPLDESERTANEIRLAKAKREKEEREQEVRRARTR